MKPTKSVSRRGEGPRIRRSRAHTALGVATVLFVAFFGQVAVARLDPTLWNPDAALEAIWLALVIAVFISGCMALEADDRDRHAATQREEHS